MQNNSISAVILAAGLSARFGGKFKALRQLQGQSLLERIVKAFKQGGLHNIMVVTGHQAEECSALARSLSIQSVKNADFAQGVLSSIKTGLLAACKAFPGSQAVLLSPVDAALLMPRSIEAMLQAWQQQASGPSPQRIIIASFNGRPGHPVLLPKAHISAVLNLPDSGEALPEEGADAPWGLRGYYAALFKQDSIGIEEQVLNFLHPQNNNDYTGQKLINMPLPDAGVLSVLDSCEALGEARDFLEYTEKRRLPAVEEAWQLLCLAKLSATKMRHSILVAQGSLRIGLKMSECGYPHNLLLLTGAGLLHDILRMEWEHAIAGAKLLKKLGWHKSAFIVGCHTSLPEAYLARLGLSTTDTRFKSMEVVPTGSSALDEELFYSALAVYMADKYARRDSWSSIDERFYDISEWFKEEPGAVEGIAERERVVKELEKKLENMLGCKLAQLVATPSGHQLEATLQRLIAKTGVKLQK